MKKHKIIVVVPIYKDLSDKDKTSLEFLRHNITKHDKMILCPIGFDLSKVDTTGFSIKRISPSRFKTNNTNQALLMSKRFYSYFKDYDYILYHKLGCIVFGNDEDLEKWADKEYSYIGAPWFKKSKNHDRRSVAGGAGIGSLSLRHVPSFLNTFKKDKISLTPYNRQSKQFFLEWRYWNRLKRFGAWVHMQQLIRNRGAAHHMLRRFDKPEDMFWAFFAVQINQGFKLSSFDDGYKFAIEHTPYAVYHDVLPFGLTDKAWQGSHKWDKVIELHKPKPEEKKAPVKKKTIKKKVASTKKKSAKKAGTKSTTAKKSTVTKKRTTRKKSIKKAE